MLYNILEMHKHILFFFVALLIFTEGLILFHNSPFEKSEYDRICNNIYTEKFWIDSCYIPYYSEIKTFEMARNIEIIGLIGVGSALLYLKKIYFKN